MFTDKYIVCYTYHIKSISFWNNIWYVFNTREDVCSFVRNLDKPRKPFPTDIKDFPSLKHAIDYASKTPWLYECKEVVSITYIENSIETAIPIGEFR